MGGCIYTIPTHKLIICLSTWIRKSHVIAVFYYIALSIQCANNYVLRTEFHMLVVYFFSCLSQLADGLIYEASDDNNYFPHFYGPGRSFVPLQLDAVVKADKIELADNDFTCALLDGSDLPS